MLPHEELIPFSMMFVTTVNRMAESRRAPDMPHATSILLFPGNLIEGLDALKGFPGRGP
jgi:hypothetical protein